MASRLPLGPGPRTYCVAAYVGTKHRAKHEVRTELRLNDVVLCHYHLPNAAAWPAAGAQCCSCHCCCRRARFRPGAGSSQGSSQAYGHTRHRSGRRSASLETTDSLETTTDSPLRSPSQNSSPVLGAGSARRKPSLAATPAVSRIRSRSQSQSSSPVLHRLRTSSAGDVCASSAVMLMPAEITSGGADSAGGAAGVVSLVLASRLAAAAPPANCANSWTTVCPLRLCAPDERGVTRGARPARGSGASLATSQAVSPQPYSPVSQPAANGAAAAAAANGAGALPAAGTVASAIAASNLLILV